MTRDDAEHREIEELLPWWVNGSLSRDRDEDREAARRVEAHLAHCEDCRRHVILLTELGEALETAAQPIQREGREGQEGQERQERPRPADRVDGADRVGRTGWLTWAGWAAAAVLAVALGVQSHLQSHRQNGAGTAPGVTSGTSGSSGSSAVIPTYRLDAVRRSSGATVVVPSAPELQLLVHVDLGPGALPLELRLEAADGRTVLHQSGIRDLYEGRFLFLLCTADDVPPGRYRLTLRGHGPDAPAEPLVYSFRVDEPPDRASGR